MYTMGKLPPSPPHVHHGTIYKQEYSSYYISMFDRDGNYKNKPTDFTDLEVSC